MEFETFKKHINRILVTKEKEEKLSDCIEENLASITYCIVDIASDVCTSVEELLADYYDCYYDILGHKENDISWWIYDDNRKIYYKNKDGSEKVVDLSDLEVFWKYLEDEKKKKVKTQ